MLYIPAVLKHYWQAKTAYKTHSPFLSAFIENVLEDNTQLDSFDTLKNLTHPSGDNSYDTLRSQTLSQNSLQFLFRFSNWYQADETAEIGAVSPISSLYLLGINPDSKLSQLSHKKRQLFVVYLSEMSSLKSESVGNIIQEKSGNEYALIVTGIYSSKANNLFWKKLRSSITGSFIIEANNMGLIIQQNQPFPYYVHLIHRKYKPYQLY